MPSEGLDKAVSLPQGWAMANPQSFHLGIASRVIAAPWAVAALLLSACSDQPSGNPTTSVTLQSDGENDPDGAALPLSIGGRVETETGDALSTAVNCAAALGITAERLATVTENPLSNEIALINRAQDFFIARAGEAAEADDTAVGSVEASVARRREEKGAEITTQAQLAIACLRRFGDSVDPQTGQPI